MVDIKMDSKRGVRYTLILLACISLSRAQCPEGWTSAGFHCYKAFDQPQTWKDAESHCQSFSVGKNTAHVTSVLGIPENVLLKNWLELTKTNVTESWLGLHPVDNEEEVLDDEWSDGGHADLTVWIEEGILDDEFMFMTKMCLVLNTAEGIWLPTDCNKPRPYVCKLSTCPPGWVAHGGRCYHAFNSRKPWVHAEKHCNSFAKESEAHLAGIADAMENRFLASLPEETQEPFWIGMKGVNKDNVTSTWSEDVNFDLAGVENDKGDSNGTCVEMHIDDGIAWEDAPCSYQRPYVCQLSHCRRGWTPIEGTCMWYTSETKKHPAPKTSSSATKGHKRVRRGFNFNRMRMKPGSFKKKVTTTNLGNGKRTFGKTTTTRRVSSTRTVSSKLSNKPPMAPPSRNRPKMNNRAAGGDPNMRCLGGWGTQANPEGGDDLCMRSWPDMPMKYYDAKAWCLSFTYTGESMKEIGYLITPLNDFIDPETREALARSFTCQMRKVKKTIDQLV